MAARSSFKPSMKDLYDINNIKAHIPLILDLDSLNYDAWCELFETLCIGFGVIDHIHHSNDKVVDDPDWNQIDSIVKLWIYGTISKSLLQTILKREDNNTARQVWNNIWTVVCDVYSVGFNYELRNIVIGDYSSVTDYCTRIKTVADYLDHIHRRIPENKLVTYTINGLSPKFESITGLIRQMSPLPSFLETGTMLLLEESRMSQINILLNHIIMCPDIFFMAMTVPKIKTAYSFQVLGEGYQAVSGLDQKVEACDKNRKSRVPDDLFEDYIGQLYMSAILQEEGEVPEILKKEFQERMREFQEEREAKLITILKNRLQPFVKGQTTEFVNWEPSEAHQLFLSQAPFGEVMLHTIGYIYTRQAARELAKDKLYMIPFLAECVWNIGHQIKSQVEAISGEVEFMKIQEEVKKLNNSERKEEQIMKFVEEKKDQMVKYLWQINVVDIETTLSRVCQAVLKDPTVSKDELKQRAIGMKKLGTLLQGIKKQEGAQVKSPSASK